MAELVDAHGSGPCGATRGGSSPLNRTKLSIAFKKRGRRSDLIKFAIWAIASERQLHSVRPKSGVNCVRPETERRHHLRQRGQKRPVGGCSTQPAR